VNWLMAHRVAAIAAANLRRRLGLPEDGYVDVFAALRHSGLMVMGKEMPALFGMYFPPILGKRHGGIILNSTMAEVTIRHTAAHELGHAELGHQRCDADGPDPFSGPPQTWSDEEKQAEAFASWFLMPIKAVNTTLTRLGLSLPTSPMDVYQLSLHLGTSYRGTLRHLEHLKMVRPEVAEMWRKTHPKRLRAVLSGQTDRPPTRVWDLSALTEGSRLPVERGDRLIVRAPWLGANPKFSGPDAVTMAATPHAILPDEGVEFDIDGKIENESQLSLVSRDGSATWSVTLMPTPTDRRGLIASARAKLLVGPTSGVLQ
jgi:Zn-dependent peptidase ImmA (M78 family)